MAAGADSGGACRGDRFALGQPPLARGLDRRCLAVVLLLASLKLLGLAALL
jgi:hypothetical protein